MSFNFMAIYTKILRHLNAKWFVNSAKDGCLFCGVSKSTLQITDQEPNLSTVLNSCEIFSKLDVQFVELSTSEDSVKKDRSRCLSTNLRI